MTNALALSNYISAIFILIGLSMYYTIVAEMGIIWTMMFILCCQVAIMIGQEL